MNPPDQAEASNHLHGSGTDRSFYLQRLPREYYQADAVVHWTMPIALRGTGWLNDAFHAHVREVMLHAAAREGLFCPTYCLMPDHIHLVWMGMRRDSDQKNGIKFLREHLGPKLRPHQFQHQAHDQVLREEQRKRHTFAKVCFYILDNARKEGLVEHPKDWTFCGAAVPGYPAMHPLEDDFWPTFWKIYAANLAADAGKIVRPPF
jgi:REP element-mobilizing transposase RayT